MRAAPSSCPLSLSLRPRPPSLACGRGLPRWRAVAAGGRESVNRRRARASGSRYSRTRCWIPAVSERSEWERNRFGSKLDQASYNITTNCLTMTGTNWQQYILTRHALHGKGSHIKAKLPLLRNYHLFPFRKFNIASQPKTISPHQTAAYSV